VGYTTNPIFEMEIVDVLRTARSWLRIAAFDHPELIEEAITEVRDKLVLNPEIVVFGKKAYQHRSVGFFSDDETIGYQYSGSIATSQLISPSLSQLLAQVNQTFEAEYNGVLVNYYSDGSDYIGAHSDDERHLGPIGVISLSYGTTRKFRIRDRLTKAIVMDVPLPSGMLVHMGGDFQKEFTHEVPIEKKVREGRYSLTFRQHLLGPLR
jgi:alkylated DNA repair dioxygenase AlkB